MPKRPSLALARRIVSNYRNDDFSLIIIYGNLRSGKSTYAIKALEEAHQYLGFLRGKMTPDHLKWRLGFEPEEVVETWSLVDERQPCFIWDDAGYWLHSMNWNDPLMISIQQYFNVVGTDYNTIILTTPHPKWVLSKIANMPEMIRIKITKRDGGNRDSEYVKFARKAKGYQKWESPDLKRDGVNTKIDDLFSCKMEQDLYDWYKPIRDDYARQAKQAILKNLRRQQRKRDLEELKQLKTLRRLEKEIFGDIKTEVDPIETK